jgi:hypothetical protein
MCVPGGREFDVWAMGAGGFAAGSHQRPKTPQGELKKGRQGRARIRHAVLRYYAILWGVV